MPAKNSFGKKNAVMMKKKDQIKILDII